MYNRSKKGEHDDQATSVYTRVQDSCGAGAAQWRQEPSRALPRARGKDADALASATAEDAPLSSQADARGASCFLVCAVRRLPLLARHVAGA